jgi:hypothetical protein
MEMTANMDGDEDNSAYSLAAARITRMEGELRLVHQALRDKMDEIEAKDARIEHLLDLLADAADAIEGSSSWSLLREKIMQELANG